MNESNFDNTSSLKSDATVDVSLWLLVIGWFELGWIILANGVIITCFLLNRHSTWPSFVKQVFFLSLNDMIIGIISIPAMINVMDIDAFANFGACITSFYLFFFSQCTCLFHIFGVCIHRYARLRDIASREQRLNAQLPVYLSVASWMISAALIAVPFILWADQPPANFTCAAQGVFSNTGRAMKYIGITLFVPLVLTNTLYLAAFARLKLVWRQALTGYVFQIFASRPCNNVNRLADEQRSSESQELTPGDAHSPASTLAEVDITENRYCNRYSRSQIRMQRKVLGTIGLVTLFVNMFTIPYILLLIFWKVSGVKSRDMRCISSLMLLLNSALNPFIYANRIVWLNARLKRMFLQK